MASTSSSIETLRHTLVDDVADCWLTLKKSDEPLHRRNYVRAVFAMVDGFLSALKAHTIEEWEAGRFTPTRPEIALLFEEAYYVDDHGRADARPAFLPMKNNVRFAFDVFARAHGVGDRPDYTHPGWPAFQTATEVRNRITHPKAAADLEISDPDLKAIEDAFSWFLDATFVVYAEGRANVVARLQLAAREAPG